jgi:hypothetical protein
MARWWIAALLVWGAAVGPAPAAPESPPVRVQPVLLQEPRLETTVTLQLRKCPLSAVLAGIEQQTGVKLSAAREVAEEPAIVFVTGQPAREVMQHLATLFNFRWTRKGKPDQPVYELYQDLKSRQEEEALREQGVQKALAGLQRALRDRLELTRRSPEALQREADALAAEEATIEAALRSAGPGSAALGRYGSVEAAHRRLLSLDMAVVQRRTMADPLQRVLTRIAGTLTPAQWEALQAGQSLVFSTRPEAGTLPLSPGLSQSLRGAKLKWGEPHITYRHESPEEEARFRQMEAEMQQGWERAAVIRLSLWLDVSPRSFGPLDHAVRPGEAPSRQAALQVVPLVQPAADLGTPFLTRPTGLKIASHEVPEAEEAKGDTGKGDRTGAPPDTDPILEIKRPFPLRLKSTDPDANWFHAPFPNEVLPLIATRYGVNVIADAYRQRFLFAPSEPSGAEQTLRAALDRYVLPRARWSREGAFIHVRRWTWYDDRLAEIPERLVNHWSERLRKQRLLSPDEAGELALSLQDPQLEAFEAVMRDEGVNFVSLSGGLITRALDADVLEKKELLRAYASLSSGQRQSLMAGRPLSWSEMPASARQWLRAALWQQLRLPADPTDHRRMFAQPLLTLTPVQGLRLNPVKIEDSAVPGGSYVRYDFDLQFREDNRPVDFFLFSPRIELKRPTQTRLILADDEPSSPSPPPTGVPRTAPPGGA